MRRYIRIDAIRDRIQRVMSTSETPEIEQAVQSYHNFNSETRKLRNSFAYPSKLNVPQPHKDIAHAITYLGNQIAQISLPGNKVLALKHAHYSSLPETPETKKALKDIEKLMQMPTTAAVGNGWDKISGLHKFIVMYSQDFDEKLKQQLPPDRYKMGYLFIQYHEILGHAMQGDLPIQIKKAGEAAKALRDELTPTEVNIVNDLRINSTGTRTIGPEFQQDFPDGIYGNTFRNALGPIPGIVEFVHDVAHGKSSLTDKDLTDVEPFLEVLKQLNDAEKKNPALKSKTSEAREIIKAQMNEQLKGTNWENLAASIAKYSKQDCSIADGILKTQQIDFPKSIESLKKVKDLDSILAPYQKALEHSLRENATFGDFIDKFEKQYLIHESRGMAFPSEKTLGRVYGAIKSKLVFKPGDGGGGGGGGGGGSPRGPDDPFRDEDEEIELDDDDIVEVDDDEGAAGEAKSRGDIRNAARPFFEKNQPPGTGTSDANRDLAEIHCQELESYISRYLRTFGQKASLRPVVKKIMKSIVPGYVMDPIQKEAAKQVEETGGHGVIGLPVGTRSSRVKNRPLNGVVLAIVDESQSMTDPAVAAAKTALMNTCAQQKLAVISVGMAESTNDLGFATFIKGQTNPKDFMKRFKEGGTGAFHQILFDFPEIMKDTKIQKALTDALPKHISVDDLLQLHKEGKMCGIIVTDGDIQTEHLSGSRLDAYRNYAERYKATVGKGEPPLYLLSIKKSHVPPVAPNNPKLYDGVNLNMPELLR